MSPRACYQPRVGFLSGRAEAAHRRQRDALVAEASKAGSVVTDVVEVGATDGARVLSNTWSSLFGGSHAVDAAQILSLRTGASLQHYVQPYAGLQAMPGEHHVLLAGALPAPASLVRSGGAGRWTSPDPGLAGYLEQNLAVRAAVASVVWDWRAGFGEILLPWTVQLRSNGDGRTHLVVAAGRYGGFTTYDVGFGVFAGVARALQAVLGPGTPPQSFLEPCAWADLLASGAAR